MKTTKIITTVLMSIAVSGSIVGSVVFLIALANGWVFGG